MEKPKAHQITHSLKAASAAFIDELFRTSQAQAQFPDERRGNEVLFGQELFSMRERINASEKRIIRLENSLTLTRPHAEPVADNKDILFKRLHESVDTFLSDFEDLADRLSSFMGLKAVLADLNKEARKCGNVYLLRSIVAFYASIRHVNAEDIDERQRGVIRDVSKAISGEIIDRARYREIYKKLRSVGFRIIPEPDTVKEDE
ncbi:MAG: hypothetical protein HY886_03185 [Deltaproteobacteria bacterium]|nr:hypothetical protein [Deltaproteobacteria bacterium]